MATTAEYAIRVRDGSTLKLVGELSKYRQAMFTRLHNGVGSWAIELDANDPLAGSLAADKAGIQVLRTIRNPTTGAMLSSSVLFSGPRWGRVRHMKNNTLIASGFDDNIWLQGRLAYPVTSYPYASAVGALTGLKRYYRLGEASGTTMTDSSTSAQNGTYSGTGITYGWLQQIDDSDTAIRFVSASSGHATFPTTGLPTGNSPWSMGGWLYIASLPASGNAHVLSYGMESVAGQNPIIYFDNTGNLYVSGWAWGNQSYAASVGVWYFVVATWDGTTLTYYLDGQPISTATPGAMTIPTSGLSGSIASNHAGTANFADCIMDEAFICAGALSAASIAHLYAVGVSRFAAQAYDTQTGAAETVIRHYVDVNAVSAINDPQGQSRVVPFLTLAADVGRGSSVSGNARLDQLVSNDGSGLLQQLAITGGMGYKIAQSGTSLVFSQYVPTDKSATVIFSQAFGNLADFSYQEDGPDFTQGGNSIIVGGGGQGTDRIFVVRRNAASITKWGRFEGYTDARDTTDITTLDQRGDAALAQISSSTQSSVVLAPQVGVVYGQDFDLGDKVSVIIDGVTFTEVVRGVQIELSQSGAETVTPIISTPSADTVGQLFGGYVQRKTVAQLQSLVSKLARST